MPGDLVFFPADATPLMTPDALAVMLRQSGLRCGIEKNDEGDVDIVLDADKTALLLTVDDGFVSSIVVDVTFVDEAAKAPRVCEMLEMMGWMQE